MPNGLALAIILLVVMLFVAYLFSLILNFLTPYYSTPLKTARKIAELFKLKPTDSFADLGSGDGRMLFETYRQYKCRVTGYEISPILLIFFKMVKFFRYPFNNKVHLKEESFFNTDLSKYDVIYCCLPDDILSILEKKFDKELKQGAKVYSYTEKLIGRKGEEIVINGKKVYQYTF